jgi:hypothetical protein
LGDGVSKLALGGPPGGDPGADPTSSPYFCIKLANTGAGGLPGGPRGGAPG